MKTTAIGRPDSAFGADLAARPANLITLCDDRGIDFVTLQLTWVNRRGWHLDLDAGRAQWIR
jgi:hypothetical protein